jgi:non-heme chloroperoxidase
MTLLTVGRENGSDIELSFEDHGRGPAVLLVHGYPFTSQSWERQVEALLDAGYRVVTYDRRGFGRSSRPATGYDIDTLAADLNLLIEYLDLVDLHLVGFGLGTGEVARYLSRYGSARVRSVAFIGALPPFLLWAPDNPEGLDAGVFDAMREFLRQDRYAYLEEFLTNAYNADVYGGDRISDQAWHASFVRAIAASPRATLGCVDALCTDFRSDLASVDVPTLIVHGADDRIHPFGATASRLVELVTDARLVTVEGGPHAVTWTHGAEVNETLLRFFQE